MNGEAGKEVFVERKVNYVFEEGRASSSNTYLPEYA